MSSDWCCDSGITDVFSSQRYLPWSDYFLKTDSLLGNVGNRPSYFYPEVKDITCARTKRHIHLKLYFGLYRNKFPLKKYSLISK